MCFFSIKTKISANHWVRKYLHFLGLEVSKRAELRREFKKGVLQTHPWEYALKNKNTQRVGEMTWSVKSCCASKRDLSLGPPNLHRVGVVEKGFSLKLIF